LCTMVGQMTYGKKKWEHLDLIMRENIPVVHRCMTELLPFVDLDASAFDFYMKALKIDTSIEGEEKYVVFCNTLSFYKNNFVRTRDSVLLKI